MQKLLRRSPSTPILCSAGDPSLSLGFRNKGFLSLDLPPKPIMRAATTFHLRPTTAVIGKTTNVSHISTSSSCRMCRCSIDGAFPPRAWTALKESRVGFQTAWTHTVAEKGVAVVAAVSEDSENLAGGGENEKWLPVDLGSEEKRMRLQRVVEKGVAVVAEDSEKSAGGGENENGLSADSGSEEKRMRLQRRQRGSSCGGAAAALAGNPDLLSIPGVGPRNCRKLVEKGISDVAELKQLYKDKFFGKSSQKMVEYLQGSVGIIHKNHAESITIFIKERVDDELKDDGSNSDVRPAQKKRLTFCVEGNISVGKTTFLQRIANETIELQDLVEIVPEPISKWQDVGPDHFNILDAFYAEPQRYAYTFQNYVFVTRLMQEKESSAGIKPLRLMERSVFSDRMVFVRAVHEAKWMNEMEISIYDSWFDPVVSSLPGLVPDGFIYLRATPDTCHRRMMLRKRSEEGGVTLDYLRDLHEKHESWLFPFQSGNHGVLSVNKPLDTECSLHPEIRDRVFYLEGDHMHSSIQRVPALVLDCEPNIDFSKDIEAKRQYARQVAEFFEYVKKKQQVPAPKEGKEAARRHQPQVLLPRDGDLWVPKGKHLPNAALNNLDFRRAMSIMSG